MRARDILHSEREVFIGHFQVNSGLPKVRFFMPRVTNDTRFCEKVAIWAKITMPSSNQQHYPMYTRIPERFISIDQLHLSSELLGKIMLKPASFIPNLGTFHMLLLPQSVWAQIDSCFYPKMPLHFITQTVFVRSRQLA